MDAIEQSITTFPNYQVVGFLIETYGPAAANLSAAALQVAIWEAVFESSATLDTTVGGFFVDEAPVGAYLVHDAGDARVHARSAYLARPRG